MCYCVGMSFLTQLKWLALAYALLLSACGTTNTVLRDEYIAVRNLHDIKTYCKSIPRVYSGVAYDVCKLNAQPVNVHDEGLSEIADIKAVPFAFLDIIFSAVFDTLALPYTIYRQSRDGSIELK